jgi:hypothetical protein
MAAGYAQVAAGDRADQKIDVAQAVSGSSAAVPDLEFDLGQLAPRQLAPRQLAPRCISPRIAAGPVTRLWRRQIRHTGSTCVSE